MSNVPTLQLILRLGSDGQPHQLQEILFSLNLENRW